MHDRILAERARYVSAGVSTPKLVVSHADGARVTDVDGRSFIDFAGGIGCQNTGHRFGARRRGGQGQLDEYLHQCFMVGVYEPYVDVCRRLAELSPCAGEEQKSILVNSGAEAVENAVKIARCATGRPAVVVFDNAFHGRTLLTMTMTAKVKPYKAGFGPFAPEVYRAPVPNPYRGVSTEDAIAGLKRLFKADVDPATVACAVLEPVQGEGGFLPMPGDYLAAPAGDLPRARDPLRRRRGAVGDGANREGVGRRAPRRRRARTCSSRASRSAAVSRSPPSRDVRRSWTRFPPADSAARSAATRSRARPRSRCSTRSPSRLPRSGDRARRDDARAPRRPRGEARCDRRGARARADARVRARRAGSGAGAGDRRCGVRARAALSRAACTGT